MRIKEETRRTLALALTIGGWLGSFGVLAWATISFDPSDGHFAPQWVGPSIFLMMGIAIAAGVAVGRFRSVDTVVKAFQAGQEARRKEGELARIMESNREDIREIRLILEKREDNEDYRD